MCFRRNNRARILFGRCEMKEELYLELKHCPIGSQELPIAEFGVCRARKDGRNLYCKSCIRNKVTQSRRALKEYKSARKRYISQQVEISESLTADSGLNGQYGCR